MDERPHIIHEMPKRCPTDGTFELTVRCNLHCKMCLFRHDDSENAEIMSKELTAEQWIDMAGQVADAGTVSLLITGGEPLLRPDFCEIWEGIYKKGFLITLYTNATLVTDKVMETLRKYPPHKIGVTIYGSSPETYEKVCGNSEAFKWTMNGIELLQTLPSKIEFRTTVIKDNFGDVHSLEQLVKEKLQSDSELIETRIVMNSVRGACTNVAVCRLDAKDNIKLLLHRSFEQVNRKAQKKGIHIIDYGVNIEPKKPTKNEGCSSNEKKPTFLGCNAGMSSYTISWDGKLLFCQLLEKFTESVVHNSFKSAWDTLPFRFEKIILCDKCKRCSYRNICPACPASRYAETGDMGGCADYLCKDVEELLKYVKDKVESI